MLLSGIAKAAGVRFKRSTLSTGEPELTEFEKRIADTAPTRSFSSLPPDIQQWLQEQKQSSKQRAQDG